MMRTAFVVFEGMTALDFVGIYDPLSRLNTMRLIPDFQWRICSLSEIVSDGKGLRLSADAVGESLEGYDLVVVPGGLGTRSLQHDATFIRWLQTAAAVPLKASVCTGSLLLGAAGFLQGKPATTHPSALAELVPYCAEVVDKRIVDAGDVITAGGVTAGIDLGLYLVERLAGPDARTKAARQMDYSYQGPRPSTGGN
jgi:transcriptional regulator GlxA family with amidase domain